MADLWVEAYRPTSLDGYVFKNENVKEQVLAWLEAGEVPGHMLFSGPQGTGKTTLAKLLLKEFGIPGADILEINGSLEGRLIDTLREKIDKFCSTYSFGGGLRYVLMDEADYLNALSVQPAMRNVMEKYADACRFIFTCNYPQKIIAPLHSRLQQIQFEKLDETEFTTRALEVLLAEGIDFDPDLIGSYVELAYPDLRKCINLMQQNSVTGTLKSPDADTGATLDYIIDATALITNGKINEARKLICSQVRDDDYPDVYKFAYNNLELWSDNLEKQEEAILIIAKYLNRDYGIDDREINLSACFVELGRI